MRIVYLSPSGQLGGAEKVLLNIFAGLRTARPDWKLYLIACSHGPLGHKASELGIDVHTLEFPTSLSRLGDAGAGGPAGRQTSRTKLILKLSAVTPSVIIYAKRLRALLTELMPDVVHSNGFKMHILGALACPQSIPLLWHMHEYVSGRPLMAQLLKLCTRRFSLAITNSNSVGEDLRSAYETRALPGTPVIQTVYNGIDLDEYSPYGHRLDLDNLAGLPPAAQGTVRVGLIGTFARWKGHETFLRAFASLSQETPVRGYIVGDAVYETDNSQHSARELRELAHKFNLDSRIGFTGFVEDVPAAMRALDIVVHASTQPEPFGLVVVEGMACGRAVIASGAGGVCELIEPGVDALSHSPGDPGALAQCIEQLAQRSELRARLGTAARASAEQRFGHLSKVRELVPIYLGMTTPSMINAHPPRS